MSCLAPYHILMKLANLPAPTPVERLRVLIDPQLCEAARLIMSPGVEQLIAYLLGRGTKLETLVESIHRNIAKDAGATLEELYIAFRVLHSEEEIQGWLNTTLSLEDKQGDNRLFPLMMEACRPFIGKKWTPSVSKALHQACIRAVEDDNAKRYRNLVINP